MKLNEVIDNLDREIAFQEALTIKIKERREALSDLKIKFPDAQYVAGRICLPNVWDKITCMRISQSNTYYVHADIIAKFLLSKRQTDGDAKVYTFPYENKIAKLITTTGYLNSNGQRVRNQELQVFDYESMIPEVCPSRKKFLRRIKLYLTNLIGRGNLTLSANSFNRPLFEKLLLLK